MFLLFLFNIYNIMKPRTYGHCLETRLNSIRVVVGSRDCADYDICNVVCNKGLVAAFMNNLLIEHVESEILAHVKERIGGRARAGGVHQVHQSALLRRERDALVPHLRISEMFHYIRELSNR